MKNERISIGAAVERIYKATGAIYSVETIRRWCKLGYIDARRAGERGHYRICVKSLIEYASGEKV